MPFRLDSTIKLLVPRFAVLAAVVNILLIFATLVYFQSNVRYAVVGEDWIPTSLHVKWPGTITREKGLSRHPQKFSIQNDDPRQISGLRYEIPNPSSHTLKLRGVFSISKVVQGKKPWETARAELHGIDDKGERHRLGTTGLLFSAVSYYNTFTVSKIIEIPEHYDKVQLSIELMRATGELQIHALSLKPVAETLNSQKLSKALLVSWIIATFLLIISMWHYLQSVPLLLVLTFGSLPLIVPSAAKHAIIRSIHAPIVMIRQQLAPPIAAAATLDTPTTIQCVDRQILEFRWLSAGQKDYIREQASHFLTFLIFTLLVYWPLSSATSTQRLMSIFSLFIFASATEVFQNFSSGRTPSSSDFYSNCAGIICGLVIVTCWRFVGATLVKRR